VEHQLAVGVQQQLKLSEEQLAQRGAQIRKLQERAERQSRRAAATLVTLGDVLFDVRPSPDLKSQGRAATYQKLASFST